MKISEIYGLPFISLQLTYRGEVLYLEKILLDTGSASTLLNADIVQEIGMVPEENDEVDIIRGVGGIEYVYTKLLDSITVDGTTLREAGIVINVNVMELSIDKEFI
ncbi:aspartyl protease family protein [Paenibacillus sp. NPDC057886]|uniref:aspartyl protease family protein n=1 Tax=Paenibacillus sp. NPDC057886 TaxID=3346270 RepID=UPI0036B26AA6